ncbi:LuxR family transcriptional regulator [Leptolyngbya sp. FACHB-17]|uniref:helix-turn-helix transcriptional regulator n=2 Tax=unclassified Leptolyngbya TaxID=2650499 RepID=UPI0016805DEC|nr:LuxR family transcriptional regulator [Leptolyngbya sp. FACHB-17]MBD2082192.1 helix-turn-helix transcriptional regulator [Leptolyngbya sp. FACHB-17]
MNMPLNTPNDFLLSVLEGLVDGILIVSQQGQLLFANTPGAEICQKLSPYQQYPAEVWRSCEALIESRQWYGARPLLIESELQTENHQTYRICVQWLQLEQPCLLVRLEDQQRSLQSLAVTEAKKFGLTPREAEVWFLKRCNLSRKEIAAQLFITIDTVKKHLGNIQLKRQANSGSWC